MDQGGVGRRARGRGSRALPRAAPARGPPAGRERVGVLRQQPARQVLPAHAEWARRAARGSQASRAICRRALSRARRDARAAGPGTRRSVRTLIDAAGAPARRQEAMAVGHRAGRHVLDQRPRGVRRAADRERHDAAAVEEQQPADRTAEQQLALAVVERRVPVHLLRERQVAQHAGRAARAARRPCSCRGGAC